MKNHNFRQVKSGGTLSVTLAVTLATWSWRYDIQLRQLKSIAIALMLLGLIPLSTSVQAQTQPGKHVVIKASDPLDVSVGSTRTFYFETYLIAPVNVFDFNDYFTVQVIPQGSAKLSLPNGSFQNSIPVTVTRNQAGYARSPDISVQGIAVGTPELRVDTNWEVFATDDNQLHIVAAPPPPPPPSPVCGNGTKETGEVCDDGNTVAGDTCSANCQLVTTPTACGNGIKETGEVCDDGGQAGGPGDLCSADCQSVIHQPPTMYLGDYSNGVVSVGGIIPLYLVVLNRNEATPNISVQIGVDTAGASTMDFSLEKSGPFANTIVVPLNIFPDHKASAVFYVRGKKPTTSQSDPHIIRLGPANGITTFDPHKMPVVNVQQVTFETFPGSASLDPNDPNPNAGGGMRIFPEKASTGGAGYSTGPRNRVSVVAQLSKPIAGVKIAFKAFDVDDPSSDDPAVDPNGPSGEDNRGAGYSIEFPGVTDNEGKQKAVLSISQQPGDNFRVGATALVAGASISGVTPSQPTGLNELVTLDSPNPKGKFSAPVSGVNLPSIQIPSLSPQVALSPMLTVWRRLHIERDSMGPVEGNFVKGEIGRYIPANTNGYPVLELKAEPAVDFEKWHFENGRIIIASEDNLSTSSFKVLDNTKSQIGIEDGIDLLEISPSGDALDVTLAGRRFVLYDDDDFNMDDQEKLKLDGDSLEDIPGPDMSLVQDSDDPNKNRFAAAYIRPTYDLLAGEQSNVCFLPNSPDDNGDLKSIYKFDHLQYQKDPGHWVVYVLNGYQYRREGDLDPNESDEIGNGAVGIVDNIRGQGATVFLEEVRDNRGPTDTPAEQLFNGTASTVFHEVGHLMGAVHEDGGIMGDCCSMEFSPQSLGRIRSTPGTGVE